MKAGDKVRCIEPPVNKALTKDKIYTIVKIFEEHLPSNAAIQVKNDYNDLNRYYPRRFVVVEESQAMEKEEPKRFDLPCSCPTIELWKGCPKVRGLSDCWA